MVDMRDRLIELIGKSRVAMWGKEIPDICSENKIIADYLIENGVIIPYQVTFDDLSREDKAFENG